MNGALESWRAVSFAAALVLASCGSEISVALPMETGYGETPVVDAGAGPDVEGSTAADPPSGPADARTLPDERDAGPASEPNVVTSDAAAPDGGREPASSVSLPTTRESHTDEEPRFNVTRPADLSLVQGPLPVVVWANGRCSRSDATWSPLFERWASAGFVVLSLSSLLDQGILDLLTRFDTTTAADHAKLIDWAVAQNQSGPYAEKLDLKRIVVAGNACGGLSALEVASADSRPAGVFVLSGSSATAGVDAELMQSIAMPVGYVVGGSADTASAGATADYKALRAGVPAMVVRRREGNQQTVSTDARVLAEVAEIALNWMDLLLYGTAPAYDALTSANVCQGCTAGDWKLDAKQLETLKR